MIKRIARIILLCLTIYGFAVSRGYAAEIAGRINYFILQPSKIYANSAFALKYSIKNSGSKDYLTYGISLNVYDAQKKRIDFPAGIDLNYLSFIPLISGSIKSGSVPLVLPALANFSFPSGKYYYLAKLYASEKVITKSSLFAGTPVASGSFQEFEIYNPSPKETDVEIEDLFVKDQPVVGSTSTVVVSIRNNSLLNQFNIRVDFCVNGELIEKKRVEVLGSNEKMDVEYIWRPPDYGTYLIKGRILDIIDSNPRNNTLEVSIEVHNRQ